MEKSNSASVGNYSLGVVIVGMAMFIISDLGWLSSLKASFGQFQRGPSEKILSPEESLLEYSVKLKSELNAMENSLANEGKALKTVQSEIVRTQEILKKNKLTLKNLETEITSLTNLKTSLLKAQESPPSALDGASVTLWKNAPSSVQSFAKILHQRTGGVVSAEPLDYKGQSFVRLKGPLKYSTNGIFLTGSTLGHVALFSEGLYKMKFNRFVLAYRDTNETINERLQVITGLLRERLGQDVSVKRKKISEASNVMSDELEIWAGKEI